uniref:U44-Theraphotoxin-Sfo1a_1 n=1 Tax=Selenotholus foelschei TaxID=1905327 RepID=A0A482ZA29_9ARAC
MNVTIFALLLVLNLVMSNAAEESFGTEIEDTLPIPENYRGCLREGRPCPKTAPCCRPLVCKGPSPRRKVCARP